VNVTDRELGHGWVRLVSWNIGGPGADWRDVGALDADVALLQEAASPPIDLRTRVFPRLRRWRVAHRRPRGSSLAGRDRRLSDRVGLEPIASGPLGTAWGSLGCSRAGSWCAARLHGDDLPPVTVVSVYAAWGRSIDGYGPIWADASAHLSDLSPLLSARGHRLLAAGDLNVLYGYGEHGNVVAKRRHHPVQPSATAAGGRCSRPARPSSPGASPPRRSRRRPNRSCPRLIGSGGRRTSRLSAPAPGSPTCSKRSATPPPTTGSPSPGSTSSPSAGS
jgi:hypothetical protein